MTVKSQARIFWTILLILSLVGVLATVGHYAFQPTVEQAISLGLGPSPAWYRDQVPLYVQHYLMTFLHVVPGFFLMVMAPLQLSSRIRNSRPGLHRMIGRIFVGMAAVLVVSGAIIGFVMPFDGVLESWGSLFIALGFVTAMSLGVRAITRRDVKRHRFYMSYMLAFGYAPITMRFVLVLLTEVFKLDGQAVFAESMLLGVFINLFVVYRWLHGRSNPVKMTEQDRVAFRKEPEMSVR